ncbi:MAG: flagellin [Phycisphaerales bacterium]|nr:flagellin [Phycisphaerales bacterium]
MSRINNNPSSLIAQRNLSFNNKGLNTTLERLSTGLRINRGKDDPAGLIASENLRAEKSALTAAIANAERADQIVNIAEGGLSEVSTLLTDLRSLVTSTANNAGLSAEEKNANQLQIDSILQTIDRLSESTNFQGVKLLNGNLSFTTTGLGAAVTDFRVNSAKLNSGATQAVQAAITASAQRGGVELRLSATAINAASGSLLRIEIAGATGSREFSFGRGTNVSAAAAAVNAFKDVLGVSASVGVSGRGLVVKSTEFGSDQFASIRVVDAGGLAGANLRQQVANDEDVFTSTGQVAVANNNVLRDAGRVASDFLDVSISLRTSAAQQITTPISAFTITGGGAKFQLDSKVDLAGQTSLGIQNVASRSLGNSSLGFLSDLASGKGKNVVSGNLIDAGKVVEEAIKQVSALRGRLGAFQKNNIGATIRSLNVSLENTSSAESVIRDADFASETAALTRGQILSQAAGNSLGLANAQPQSALQLLR